MAARRVYSPLASRAERAGDASRSCPHSCTSEARCLALVSEASNDTVSARLAWLVCYIACHDVSLRANILPVVPYTLFARYALPTATVLPAAAALPTAHGRGTLPNGATSLPRSVTPRPGSPAASAALPPPYGVTNGYRVPHSVSI